jgi:uncharacterized protein
MKNRDMNAWAAFIGTHIIIRYKWAFFLLVLLLVIAGYLGVQRVEMDSSNESFLPQDDETIRQNDRFKEFFGNEEFVFILIEAPDVFDYEVLTYIRELSADLEEHLPFLKDITSLTNIEYSTADADTLYIDDLIGDTIPRDPAALTEIKRKALAKPTYINRILTPDAQNTGIAISFEMFPDAVYLPVPRGFSPLDEADWPPEQVIMADDIVSVEQAKRESNPALTRVADPRKLIAPALNAILARHQPGDFTVMATGVPVMDYEGERITAAEATRFGLIALAASIVLLLLIFRSLLAVLGPFCVLAATLILVYGMMGWLHIPISMTGMIIPPLLLVISVSYSIHVINHFRQAFRQTGSRSAAIEYTYRHSAWPCLLTAITTAMGFASFLIVPMKPIKDIGIACAFGVFSGYLLVMIVIPALFSCGKDRPEPADSSVKPAPESKFMTTWADFVLRRAPAVRWSALALVVFLLVGSSQFRVQSDFMEVLGEKISYVRQTQHIVEQLGGLYSFEVLIELPESGQAKSPEVLHTLETMAAEVNTWEAVTLSASLNDVIKDLNMTMHGDNAAYYTIPDNRDLIAQYLLLYEMSGGEDVEDWVDYEYRFLRLSVQVREVSMDLPDKFQQLTRYTAALPAGAAIRVVGDIPILMKMMRLLTRGQIKSVLAAMIVITLVMILILKSVRVGLLSMLPNVFPILAITGVMGLLDYPLDVITIMIAPMIIGIAVDDTVHYIVHFRQEFETSRSYVAANRGTFRKVGTAIVFTSVILTLGFAIFGLSVVQSMFHMAVLASVGIIAALAADLFFTPVLFVYFQPFGKE